MINIFEKSNLSQNCTLYLPDFQAAQAIVVRQVVHPMVK